MIEEYSGLLDILINVVSSVIAIEYIHHGFDKKYVGIKRFVIFLFGCLFYFGVVTFLYGRGQFEGMAGIFYGLSLLLYAQVALNGKFSEKVLLSMTWIIIALVSTYVIYKIMELVTNNSLAELFIHHRNSRIYASAAVTVVKFSLGRAMLAVKKSVRKMSGYIEEWSLTVAFFMIFILTNGLFYLEIGQMNQKSRSFISNFLVISICGIAFLLIYIYRKLIRYNEERLKAQYQLMNQEEQQKHMKYMQEMHLEIRKMKHDQLGTLEVLYYLAKEGKQEEILCYLEGMNEKLKDYVELSEDTGNTGINAALLNAWQECKESDIVFFSKIEKISMKINDLDMGILFQNLFSNAIEACIQVEGDREIELDIQGVNGGLYFKLENTIKESVLKSNPQLQTNKADKKLHGFGMESVHQIIDKYNGKFTTSEEEDRFIQEIYLSVK